MEYKKKIITRVEKNKEKYKEETLESLKKTNENKVICKIL